MDADVPLGTKVTYQASSPDEVALVEWCEAVGLTLVKRDRNTMQLRTPIGTSLHYQILQVGDFGYLLSDYTFSFVLISPSLQVLRRFLLS